MLRTGQSLLANALINLHLGRGTSSIFRGMLQADSSDWRIPPTKPSTDPANPSSTADIEAYATYVRVISYFLDDPSPLCPFSVHRMALIGKELGKEIGEWFGPSTASGALKTLTNSFPPCGLAVATATDGMVYKSDVYAASKILNDGWDEGSSGTSERKGRWGHKAVLILVGLRLGLDGVNPIYHDSIKVSLCAFAQDLTALPARRDQCVLQPRGRRCKGLERRLGLVGLNGAGTWSEELGEYSEAGRMARVEDKAFWMTCAKGASPSCQKLILQTLFTFPQSVGIAGGRPNTSYYFVASQGNSLFYLDPHFTRPAVPLEIPPARTNNMSQETASVAQTTPVESPSDMRESRTMRLDTVDVDDISDNSDNSLSPTKNRPRKTRHAKRLSIRSTPTQSPYIGSKVPSTPSTPIVSRSDRPIDVFDAPAPIDSSSLAGLPPTTARAGEASPTSPSGIDQQTAWYLHAYTDTQLKTFHSEKVRKMPLSGLDPSMLLGFLIRNEAEFEDFCERVSRVSHRHIGKSRYNKLSS